NAWLLSVPRPASPLRAHSDSLSDAAFRAQSFPDHLHIQSLEMRVLADDRSGDPSLSAGRPGRPILFRFTGKYGGPGYARQCLFDPAVSGYLHGGFPPSARLLWKGGPS